MRLRQQSAAQRHSVPPPPIRRSSATEHLAVENEPEEVVPSGREEKVDPTLAFVEAACPVVDLDHSQPRLAMSLLIDPLEYEHGHRTLKVLRRGGRRAVIPGGDPDVAGGGLYIGEGTTGPIFLDAKGERMDRYGAYRRVKTT
jgi:hypothetical protein